MEYKLSDDWKNIKDIVLWGAGRVLKKNIYYFINNFNIKYIIDSNKELDNKKIGNIDILFVDRVRENLRDYKIIIMTADINTEKIVKQMQEYGLVEFRDFCSFDYFVKEWFWRFDNKVVVREVHTSITTKCTFNCEHCNMFMPFYKKPEHLPYKTIVDDIGLLLDKVEYIFNYEFLGGEPFLHPDLKYILQEVSERYHTKIGRIGIITNGSIIPKEEVIEVMKKYHIGVNISDYTQVINYQNTMDKLIQILNYNGIEYTVKRDLVWCDFGFPVKNRNYKNEDIKKHMMCCNPVYHGVNDGKFYFCHISWSAEKCGCWLNHDGDFIELSKEIEKEEFVKYCMGNLKNEYIGLCKVCGGCGLDNKEFVPVGQQKRRI